MYPLATPPQVAAALPHKSRRAFPWLLAGSAIGVSMVVLAVLANILILKPSSCGAAGGDACPPPPPPAAPPLQAQITYTSSAYGYALEYPGGATYAPSRQDAASVAWIFGASGGYGITFKGEPSNGRSDQQLVQQLQGEGTLVYPIPQPELGYTSGAGAVYEYYDSPANGQRTRNRAVAIVAIKKGIAVEMRSTSPFVADKQFHPSPVQMDPFVQYYSDLLANTVTWKGDPHL